MTSLFLGKSTANAESDFLLPSSTGGNISINTGSNALIRASNLDSSGDITIVADNGIVIDSADNYEKNYSYSTSNHFMGSGSSEDTYISISALGSNVRSGGGSVTLTSNNNNIVLEGSNIESGADTNINSGKDVKLLTSKDSVYRHNVSNSDDGFLYSNSDSGSYNETLNYNSFNTGGNLNISSTSNTSIEYRNNISGVEGLSDSVSEISKGLGLSYLQDIHDTDSSVTWNGLSEEHRSWEDVNRGLTDTGAALVAITAAALSGGAALAAIGSTTTTLGTVAATATIAGAGTLGASVSVSAVNNEGDLVAVADELDRSETYESIAISMFTAGATSYLSDVLTEAQRAKDAANALNTISNAGNTTSRFRLALEEVSKIYGKSLLDVSVSSAIESGIRGDSFSDSISTSLESALVNSVSQVAATRIGNLYHGDGTVKNPGGKINKATQLGLHAAVGCAAGSVSGNCGAGAAGAVAGEVMAERYLSQNLDKNMSPDDIDNVVDNAMRLAELSGAYAAALAGGDGEGVYSGSRLGKTSASYNSANILWAYDNSLRADHPEIAESMDAGNELAGDVMLYGVAATPAVKTALGLGSAVVREGVKQAGKAFSTGFTRDVQVNAINGFVSSATAAVVSGADFQTGAISTAVGTGVSVLSGGVFKSRNFGGVRSRLLEGGLISFFSTTASSGLTTYLTNPNETRAYYLDNIVKSNMITLPGNLITNGLRLSGGIAVSYDTNVAFGMYNTLLDTTFLGVSRAVELHNQKKSILEITE